VAQGNESGERGARGGFLDAMSRWPATVLVASAIIVLSELPEPAFPRERLIPHADKVVHFIEYLTLGVLLFRSLCHEFSGNRRLAAIITVVAGTAFGLGEEWHQSFTGRTPDAWDLTADAVGLVCAVVCIKVVSRWRRKHVD